jgi:hypothetical protein
MEEEQETIVTTTPEITFFKMVNGFVLLVHYLQVMWFFSELPIILQILGSVTMLAGFVSLFIPNERSNVFKIKIMSFTLYAGVVTFILF